MVPPDEENVVPPADEAVETDVVPPFFEENVEPPADGEAVEFEEGLIEEFSDPDYDQPEETDADDSEEDVFFKLTERLDIGADGEENQDRAGGDDGTEYEDSDDLRSIHSDPEEGDSSNRNDVWFNPANDMQDPKFRIGKHLIQLRTCLFMS